MIEILEKNNVPDSKYKIVIDLTSCYDKKEVLIRISSKLKGKNSPSLATGNSLDACFDIVSDYFIENWLKWKDIYVYGWGTFSLKEPIYSQKILSLIMEAYLLSLSSQLQLIEWGDANFLDSNILKSTKEKKPTIYFILN